MKEIPFIRQKFTGGTLMVETPQMPLFRKMFGFGERRNPKRPFLFVNRLLGRNVPARPCGINAIYDKLAAKIRFPDGMFHLFVGLAEMATALGAGVFRACNRPDSMYLASSRIPLECELLCEFREEHSHAPAHFLYRPGSLPEGPIHLVLVDDEMTTGATLGNAEKELKGKLDIARITRVAIANWSRARNCESLIRGKWDWAGDWKEEMAENTVGSMKPIPAFPDHQVGRFGMRLGDIHDPWPDIRVAKDEKILVIGTGEYAFEPFLLAERLEREGAHAFACATTRSPAKEKMEIKSAVPHKDNYGLNVANYLYNHDPKAWDRVFLCLEAGYPDPVLLNHLGPNFAVLRPEPKPARKPVCRP